MIKIVLAFLLIMPSVFSDAKPGVTWLFVPGGLLVPERVTVASFEISKVITVRQFRAFIRATGYITDAEKEGAPVNWRFNSSGEVRKKFALDSAVVWVSRNDAMAFADWMDCSLPSKSEYRQACIQRCICEISVIDHIYKNQYDRQTGFRIRYGKKVWDSYRTRKRFRVGDLA